MKLLKLSLDSQALTKAKNRFHKVNYLLRKKNPLVGEKIAFVTRSMLHDNMSLPFPCVQYFPIILIFSRWVLQSIMRNNNKSVGKTKEVVQRFLRYTIYRDIALGKAGSKANFKKKI